MIKSPLDTLVGHAQRSTEIRQQLVQDVHLGHLAPTEGGDPSVTRYLVDHSEVPPFFIDIPGEVDNKPCLFTDVRSFISNTGKIKRIGYRDYMLRDTHSQLASMWLSGNSKDLFLNDLSFAGVVFIESILIRLIHIYRLDGEQQIIVKLILAQWYGMRIRETDTYTYEQYIRDAKVYAHININQLTDRVAGLGKIELIHTLEELIDALRTGVGGPKVANFTLTTFLVLMKTMIFVFKGEVVIPLSLEYPPMFIALTYMALTDKSMRKSYLFTAATNALRQSKKESEVMLSSLSNKIVPPQRPQD